MRRALWRTGAAACLFIVLGGGQAPHTPSGNTTNNKELKHMVKELEFYAEYLFEMKNFSRSLHYYLQIDSLLDGKKPYYRWRIAQCYLNTTFARQRALEYLRSIRDYGEKKWKEEYLLLLGEAFHLNYEFDSARAVYEALLKTLPPTSALVNTVKHRIEMAENAKQLVANPINVRIENIGTPINTEYPEYAPVISADESVLLFTSRRPGSTGGLQNIGGKPDTFAGMWFEDVYVSIKVKGRWLPPVSVGSTINSVAHDATIGLSPDGRMLFVYRSDSVRWGNIFVSQLAGYTWGALHKLPPPINSEWWEGSASITPDGNVLYFASNRPGGYGERDLYEVRRLSEGSWAQPRNLGAQVNTPYNDDAPFIHPDGVTLYFASEGHNSMGGYDIFITKKLSQKEWSKPQNIGYPINTPDNDAFLVLSADGLRAYFASVRPEGFGDMDIYVAHFPPEELAIARKEIRAPEPVALITGYVKGLTQEELQNVRIVVSDVEADTVVGMFKVDAATGKYVIVLPVGRQYSMHIEGEGRLFHSEQIAVKDAAEFVRYEKDITLKPIEVGEAVVLKNIYFDFDKATLRPESHTELRVLADFLSTHTAVAVEISGHTDAIGSREYNQRLSEARAEAVRRWLIEHGIDSTRLFARGLGELIPVKINMYPDGTDNPQGREENRRVEFRIIATRGEKPSPEAFTKGVEPHIHKLTEKLLAEWKEGWVVMIAEGLRNKPPEDFFLGMAEVWEWQHNGTYSYLKGPFANEEEARQWAEKLKQMNLENVRVINVKDGRLAW